jgi:Transposase IS116/IS110/IS902 family
LFPPGYLGRARRLIRPNSIILANTDRIVAAAEPCQAPRTVHQQIGCPRRRWPAGCNGTPFERGSDEPGHEPCPYLGLTPCRYQSGEIERAGRISKHGDRFTAPGVRPEAGQPHRRQESEGGNRPQALLAVILRCIWLAGIEFWWTNEAAMG